MIFNESFIIGIFKLLGNNNKSVYCFYMLFIEIRLVYSFVLVGLVLLYYCLVFINKNI